MAQGPSSAAPAGSHTPCSRKAQVGGSRNFVPAQQHCDFRRARCATEARGGGVGVRWLRHMGEAPRPGSPRPGSQTLKELLTRARV